MVLDLLIERFTEWFNSFAKLLPLILAALVVFVVFYVIGVITSKIIRKLTKKSSRNKTLSSLLSTLAFLFVLLLGLIVVLGVLNLDKTITSLLAGVGIIGLALGFAFQDLAANLISGTVLAFSKPLQPGDLIEVKDNTGYIESIDLRTTKIKSFQGQLITIPNKDIFQNPVTNYSELGMRRVDIDAGVSYGDDLEKVEKIALKSIKKLKFVKKDKPVELFFSEFSNSSIKFSLRFWIDFKSQKDFLDARSKAIKATKKAFDENDITIPFPIRTLNFGVKGGKGLFDDKINLSK